MSKHTPGPWFAVNDGTKAMPMWNVKAERIRGMGARHEVAICATGDSPQEMETANARLIAAAPDLLEALEALVNHADKPAMFFDAVIAARAAIAKARGEG